MGVFPYNLGMLRIPTYILFSVSLTLLGCRSMFLTRPFGQVQHMTAQHTALPTQISQLGQHSGGWALRQHST